MEVTYKALPFNKWVRANRKWIDTVIAGDETVLVECSHCGGEGSVLIDPKDKPDEIEKKLYVKACKVDGTEPIF